MSVILDAAEYDAWLSCKEVPLDQFPVERMTARPVNRWVNNVKNQGEKCISDPD